MQRVAITRALVNMPEILLADEPAGNLDTKRSAEIVRILQYLGKQKGLTVILVTHNLELATHADRTIEMKDGRITTSADRKNVPDAVSLRNRRVSDDPTRRTIRKCWRGYCGLSYLTAKKKRYYKRAW